MKDLVRPALVFLGLFTVLTGLVYPAIVTASAQLLFPVQANGSLVRINGRVVGSALIGQGSNDPRYFWGRPSATSPAWNAAESAASNLGPSNPTLRDTIQARVHAIQALDRHNRAPIPIELVTASASGLDPHISPAAALWQVDRVARVRGLDPERIRSLVHQHTILRTLGLLGEPRVSVLTLNLTLDRLAGGS